MPTCSICGEPLPDGARVCALCGSSVPETVPTAAVVPPPRTEAKPVVSALALAADARLCPACGKIYRPDYADAFCTCGMELFRADQVGGPGTSGTGKVQPGEEKPVAEKPSEQIQAGPVRPPAGTRCLVLYSADKQPLRYFPLEKDAVLIGRLDAVEGNFPDIDLMACLDEGTARKVSRKHALILRTRATNSYFLRPLAGNTGTQIEADMVPPLGDYPLEPGRRIILGGAVRFKFEIA